MSETDVDRGLLQRIEILRSSEPDVLDAIAAGATRRTYAKGAHVSASNGESAVLCLVVAGALRVYRLSPGDQEMTLAVLGTGRLYGLSFLSPQGPSPQDNLLQAAHEDTMLFHVPQQLFEGIVDSHPCIARHALHAMGETIAALADRVEDLGLHDVTTRLARALAHRITAEGSCVTVTHAELAAEIGVRREEVSRAMAKFRRQGMIRASRRGVILIADPLALAREAHIPP